MGAELRYCAPDEVADACISGCVRSCRTGCRASMSQGVHLRLQVLDLGHDVAPGAVRVRLHRHQVVVRLAVVAGPGGTRHHPVVRSGQGEPGQRTQDRGRDREHQPGGDTTHAAILAAPGACRWGKPRTCATLIAWTTSRFSTRSTAWSRRSTNSAAAAQSGTITNDEERQRLRALEESLDQCWDLLRRRRAAQANRQDPDSVQARPVTEVEGYLNSMGVHADPRPQ